MSKYVPTEKRCNIEEFLEFVELESQKPGNENNRYELIDGVIYMMASPSEWHQDMVLNLAIQLNSFLKGKSCKVIISPFDVRLFPEDDNSDTSVVIPDLIVVCDNKKISDGKMCKGAPEFIIEVLSPSTEKRDLFAKKSLYNRAGVKECWFIDRDIMFKYTLNNGFYDETLVHYLFNREPVPVETLSGCKLEIPVFNI